MTRRQFLWTAAAAGGVFAGLQPLARLLGRGPKGFKPSSLDPGLAVAEGTDHFDTTMRALDALGGLRKLVSPGDLVCVKPNIAWVSAPKYANNTNPEVVAAVVKAALDAGAGEVLVFDYPMDDAKRTYQQSGILAAVEGLASGGRAKMIYVAEDDFVIRPIPGGEAIKEWGFYRPALECDVLINVPVLKHHSSSKLTIGLKALFGVVGPDNKLGARYKRGKLHPDIHTKIVDLNRVIRTDLTVLDATRVLMKRGPAGRSLRNVRQMNTVVAGIDRGAVDAFGAEELFGMKRTRIGFITKANGVLDIPGGGKGTMNYEGRVIKR